jgi:fibronectin-binding autotransporter adhesin
MDRSRRRLTGLVSAAAALAVLQSARRAAAGGFFIYSGTQTFSTSYSISGVPAGQSGLIVGNNTAPAAVYVESGTFSVVDNGSNDSSLINGQGFFELQGGEAQFGAFFSVGDSADESAAAAVEGGTFTVANTYSASLPSIYVGRFGSGTFTQSGGYVSAEEGLYLAYGNGSSGYYSLSGAGSSLNLDEEIIGDSGNGTLVQSGGTNSANNLYLGLLQSQASGSYTLGGAGLLEISVGENVGIYGAGTFSQIGGENVADTLGIGTSGTYAQSGGTLTTGSISVSTGGAFLWTGGTISLTNSTLTIGSGGPLGSNLTLGNGQALDITNSEGFLLVENGALTQNSGSPVSVQYYEDIGNSGVGTYTQNGGANATPWLYLGFKSSAQGNYLLTGGSLSVGNSEYVGSSGSATFIQQGGVNTCGGTLSIGTAGAYALSGGSLNVGALSVSAPGDFVWTGGAFDLTNSGLAVGPGGELGSSLTVGFGQTLEISSGAQSLTVTGTLAIAGGGVVQTPGISQSGGMVEMAGGSLGAATGNLSGAGTFVQSAGAASIGGLTIGGALYDFQSGTLTASTITINSGGELRGGYESGFYFDFSAGSVTVNTGGALHLADGGFNGGWNDSISTLNVEGGTVAGSVLSAGTFNYVNGNTSGLTLRLTGSATVSNWNLAELDLDSALPLTVSSGESLSAGIEAVGDFVSGALDQTGGSNGVSYLELALNSGATGTYSLSAGTLVCTGSEAVGVGGLGTFIQSGGLNTISGASASLSLGASPFTAGYYTLSAGGSLSVSGAEVIGAGGAGTFTQNGGNNFGASLIVGSSSLGRYTLSGSGSLTVSGTEEVGNGALGSGRFVQTSGTNSALGALSIDGNGTYALSGGALNSGTLSIGSGGTFNWTGGALSAGSIDQTGGTFFTSGALNIAGSGGAAGSYVISGGVLTAGAVTVSGGGTFFLSGGAVNAGSLSLASLSEFDWTSGTLDITGSPLTIGAGGALGASFVLGAGQVLSVAEGVTVSGSLAFAGGVLAAPVTIASGGKVTIGSNEGGQTFSSLSIGGGGVLDVTNNHIYMDYGSSDPIATIAGYIRSGYNGGNWNGAGIISSSAQSLTSGLGYGVGFADGADGVVSGLSSSEIELKYTLLGDVNLDGVVNGSDFSILAANFGQGSTNWDQGNFFYTSSVNGSDFAALALNFGEGDSGADVAVSAVDIAALDAFAGANGLGLARISGVPEPGSVGLIAVGGVTFLRRRRVGRSQGGGSVGVSCPPARNFETNSLRPLTPKRRYISFM